MSVIAIVAFDENRGIGFKGDLPWKPISEDFKHFKEVTTGHPVIMGRATWDSLPKKPLSKRPNIVVSNTLPQSNVCNVTRSLEEALELAKGMSQLIFIIGGGKLYAEALHKKLVNIILATEVKGVHPADTFFPDFKAQSSFVIQEHEKFSIVRHILFL